MSAAIRALALVLAVAVAPPGRADSGDAPLSVRMVPPAERDAQQRWSIYLDGTIDEGSAQRLRDELAQRGVGSAIVYLNSPGGLLSEGMALGRLIRERGFSTSVGRLNERGPVPFAGGCYSACVMAFIGGVYRFGAPGSRLGVHRFWTPEPGEREGDAAQMISASIVTYIRDMQVDVGLFERMTRVGRRHILLLGKQDLERLGVTNDGRLPAQWTLEARGGEEVLRGEQQTWRGKGAVVLSCTQRKVLFRPVIRVGDPAVFDPDSIMQHLVAFDSGYTPLDAPLEPASVQDGDLSAQFVLDSQQVQSLLQARSVEYAAQSANAAATLSFAVDMADAGRDKIKNFVQRCTRSP